MVVNNDNIFSEEEDYEEEMHANNNDGASALVTRLDFQTERESYSRPRRANSGTDNSTNSYYKSCTLESQLFTFRGSFSRWESIGEQVLLADIATTWLGAWTFT